MQVSSSPVASSTSKKARKPNKVATGSTGSPIGGSGSRSSSSSSSRSGRIVVVVVVIRRLQYILAVLLLALSCVCYFIAVSSLHKNTNAIFPVYSVIDDHHKETNRTRTATQAGKRAPTTDGASAVSIAVEGIAANPSKHIRLTAREQVNFPLELPVQDSSLVGCLTDACIQALAVQVARAFPDKSHQAWCIRDGDGGTKDGNRNWRGIILVKVPKGASSTSAGVAIRIGRRRQCRAVQWIHRDATDYASLLASSGGGGTPPAPEQTYLFTTVRNPAERAISTIFFHVVSRTPNLKVTDDFIRSQLRSSTDKHWGATSAGQGGFQLRYISLQSIPEHSAWRPHEKTVVREPERVLQNVLQVVNQYDFLIVTERMDESLTAMALLMGIDVGDVLVTSSKVAGSRYHFAKQAKGVFKCLPTVKSFVSPSVQQFLDSDEWRAMNYGDYLLHAIANHSLDRTIQVTLGRERFDAALARYRRLRALEQQQCASRVKFPCSDDGVPQPKESKTSCYLPFFDFGCGYKCIDHMIEQNARGQHKMSVD